MNARVFHFKQQSDAWLAAHRGRITASGLCDIMAAPTTRASTRKGVACPAGTEAREREEYREKLIVERLYGHTQNNYVTRAMEEGLEREPYARMLFESEINEKVEQVGFALHPLWDWCGCSPDGLICGGGCEFKSPTDIVHDRYARDPSLLAEEYKWQCLMGLICFPELDFWSLSSFNPFAPVSIKLVKAPIFHRSDWESTIGKIESAIFDFNTQIEENIIARGFPATVWDKIYDTESDKPNDSAQEDRNWTSEEIADVTSASYAFLDEKYLTP